MPMTNNDAHVAWLVLTPGDRIYKEDLYTLLHIKHESSRPCSFREEDCFMFSHCKSMGANDPRGRAIFDPRQDL